MTTELFFKVKFNQKSNRKSKYIPTVMDQNGQKKTKCTLCNGHKCPKMVQKCPKLTRPKSDKMIKV